MSRIEIAVNVRIVDTEHGHENASAALSRTPVVDSSDPRYHASEIERALHSASIEIIEQVAALFGDVRNDTAADEITPPHADRLLTRRSFIESLAEPVVQAWRDQDEHGSGATELRKALNELTQRWPSVVHTASSPPTDLGPEDTRPDAVPPAGPPAPRPLGERTPVINFQHDPCPQCGRPPAQNNVHHDWHPCRCGGHRTRYCRDDVGGCGHVLYEPPLVKGRCAPPQPASPLRRREPSIRSDVASGGPGGARPRA